MFPLSKLHKTRAVLKTIDEDETPDDKKSFLRLFFSSKFVRKNPFLESVFSKQFRDLLPSQLIIALEDFRESKENDANFNNPLVINKKVRSASRYQVSINNPYCKNYFKKNKELDAPAIISEIQQLKSNIKKIFETDQKNFVHSRVSYKKIREEIKTKFPSILLNLQNLDQSYPKKSYLKKSRIDGKEEEGATNGIYTKRIRKIPRVLNFIVLVLFINLVKFPSGSLGKIPSNKIEKLIKIKKPGFFVGRESEINRIIQILSRRIKNNPILIGDAGVGKSSILEGLAIRLLENTEFSPLSKSRILSINLQLLVANNLFKKQFQKRLKRILYTIRKTSQTILILDNIHVLFGSDAKETSFEIKNLLKIALSSNKIQCLGATTAEEYKQFTTKDISLETYFQPLIIKEPNILLALQILQSIKKNYEDYHWVTYNSSAIKSAVNLSSQYITNRFLPDKAIDLIDEAGAYVKLKSFNIPNSAKIFYSKLLEIRRQKIKAISLENYELANNYLKKELELQSLISRYIKSFQITKVSNLLLVTDTEIATIIASWTGIPINKISKAESQNLLQMEEILHQRIIGQHQAIVAVSKAIRRARVGLKNPNRPIASFIFAGPTGVGKTELTKALAFYFFGSESNMVRLDMSEYMERHTVAKLIGSPPGYIGYNEGGQLTEAVRQKPYTVVLFDEMEKAHPDIFNLLLQILEDGHLTDSKGRKIDFKNTLIILTSNVGARVIENSHKNGSIFNSNFNDKRKSIYKRIWQLVNQELKNQFKPEFLNRLDEIIVFSQLTLDDITQIAEIMIKQLIKRVQKQNGIHLTITDRVRRKVIKEGFNPIYGARPLRRAVMNLLEDNLATKFLANELTAETKLIVDLDNSNRITLIIDKNI